MAEQNWFDPNTYMTMFQNNDMMKAFDLSKMPQFDAGALADAQNKNMQAFFEANRVASEGYLAVISKQMELAKEAFAKMQDSVKDVTVQPMTREAMEVRAEEARGAFEKAMTDFNALMETARGANEDAFAVLQKRFQELVAEFQTATEKMTDQAVETTQEFAA